MKRAGTELRAAGSAGGQMLPALLESTLELGAEAHFEVDGRSMLPLIRPGDVVRVRGSGGCAARVGDVVALRGVPGGNLLVHRVVGRRGQALLLRGDNTTCPDGEYAESDILGVICSVERGGRNVWFGAGHWGALVAWAVRAGLVRRFNRVASYARRRIAG